MLFVQYLLNGDFNSWTLIMGWLLLLIPGLILVRKWYNERNIDVLFLALAIIPISLGGVFWILNYYYNWAQQQLGTTVFSDIQIYYVVRLAVLSRLISAFFLTIYAIRVKWRIEQPLPVVLVSIWLIQFIIRFFCNILLLCDTPNLLNFWIPTLMILVAMLLFAYVHYTIEISKDQIRIAIIAKFYKIASILFVIAVFTEFLFFLPIYLPVFFFLFGSITLAFTSLIHPDSFYISDTQFLRALDDYQILTGSEEEPDMTTHETSSSDQLKMIQVQRSITSSYSSEKLRNLISDTFMKKIFHPVKLGVLKILIENYELPTAEVRKKLGISWGALSNHLRTLKDHQLVSTRDEFVDTKLTQLLVLEKAGEDLYQEFIRMLSDVFEP